MQTLNLDFSNLIVIEDSLYSKWHTFDVMPRDYLMFAREDRRSDGVRGAINSITNAKRAIDCQNKVVQNALFGDSISKQLREYVDLYSSAKKEESFDLRMISSFNLAPIGLISKVRKIRHKIEHEFKIPNQTEVEDAVELAELFINCIENKIKIVTSFELTDVAHFDADDHRGKISGYYVSYEEKEIHIQSHGQTDKFTKNDPEFFFLAALMVNLESDKDYFSRKLAEFSVKHLGQKDNAKIKVVEWSPF